MMKHWFEEHEEQLVRVGILALLVSAPLVYLLLLAR